MSRGPGQLQRYLLSTVLDGPDGAAIPSPLLARWYARDHEVGESTHLRASIRRALNGLMADGRLDGVMVELPTTVRADFAPAHWQMTLCATKPFDGDDAEVWNTLHTSAMGYAQEYLYPLMERGMERYEQAADHTHAEEEAAVRAAGQQSTAREPTLAENEAIIERWAASQRQP